MEPTIESFNLFFTIGWPILLLVVTYLIGNFIERRHFRSIREREAALHGFPVISFATMPDDWRVGKSTMVAGSTVVSLDYFKRVIAGLKTLIGGRVTTYEPLLDRARREALLRMTAEAQQQGFDAIINVRLETSRLANSRGKQEGIAGVEMLAYGTAVKFASRFVNPE